MQSNDGSRPPLHINLIAYPVHDQMLRIEAVGKAVSEGAKEGIGQRFPFRLKNLLQYPLRVLPVSSRGSQHLAAASHEQHDGVVDSFFAGADCPQVVADKPKGILKLRMNCTVRWWGGHDRTIAR